MVNQPAEPALAVASRSMAKKLSLRSIDTSLYEPDQNKDIQCACK